MAIFNPRQAVQKLRDRGASEPLADGVVEVVEEATTAATGEPAAKDDWDARFAARQARADAHMNRGIGILIVAMVVIAAIALTIAKLT